MKITSAQYAQSWYEILRKSTNIDAATRSLLGDIHRAGKLKLLPEILRLMKEIELREQGKVAVTIATAHALSEETLQAIARRTVGETPVEISTIIDSNLIGGARVRTQNEQWDLSVVGQLNAMRNQLLKP